MQLKTFWRAESVVFIFKGNFAGYVHCALETPAAIQRTVDTLRIISRPVETMKDYMYKTSETWTFSAGGRYLVDGRIVPRCSA